MSTFISRKHFIFNIVLGCFIFLIIGIYLFHVVLSTKYNLEIKKTENSLHVLRAEKDYLSRKMADENTTANLFEISQKIGLVKTHRPEYITTTEEIFVAR